MASLTYSGTTVTLPDDMLWTDEFLWNKVVSTNGYSVAGVPLIDSGLKVAGRPFTLQSGTDHGWISRSTALTLQGWAWLPSPVLTLVLRGTTYNNLTFDQSGNAFEATPVVDYSDPTNTDRMYATLRLIAR